MIDPFTKRQKEQERRLRRLERLYDKNGEPQRQYQNDLREITALCVEGVIDRDHADLLRERANNKYQAHREKVENYIFERQTTRKVKSMQHKVFIGLLLIGILFMLFLEGRFG